MGRRTGFLVTALLAAFSWLALAGSAQAEDLSGTYIVVDGQLAGDSFVADATGKVSAKGQIPKHKKAPAKAQPLGFVNPADSDCPMRHYKGVLGDPEEKPVTIKTDCVRVINGTTYANEFLDQIVVALQAEQKGKLKAAETALDHAGEGLDFQQQSGTVDPITTAEIDKHLKKAKKLDNEAEDARKSGDKKRADALLERAEHHKHTAAQIAPDAVKLVLPPTLKPIDAVFQAANSQTVYTENLTPRPGSTVQYRWTLVELNDPTCILFDANKPQPNQAIWHHSNTQGCNHALEGSNGHQGVIGLLTYDNYYLCSAVYFGSNTATGPPPPDCQPRGPQ